MSITSNREKVTSSLNEGEINHREAELLKKAELVMELRDYQAESVRQDEDIIRIKASNPDSDETALMYIVTESKLKSNSVGLKRVRKIEQILEESEVDKVILFAERFTSSAKKELHKNEIKYFSQKQQIIPLLDYKELYFKILECIDKLCQMKCGRIPQSEAECGGYQEKVHCSLCGGSGELSNSSYPHWKLTCHVCGGTGSKENHYSCEVRRINDNANFHFTQHWLTLLQNDLLSILQILRTSKHEVEVTPLIQSSPIETSLEGR